MSSSCTEESNDEKGKSTEYTKDNQPENSEDDDNEPEDLSDEESDYSINENCFYMTSGANNRRREMHGLPRYMQEKRKD